MPVFIDWAAIQPPVFCQRCGKTGAVKYRQRTSYVNEESNWATLCPPCQEKNDRHWDYMWCEYYAGCL